MNKILVTRNKITSDDGNILINDKTITINDNADYVIEYGDSGQYRLKFIINGTVSLTEVSFDKELSLNNQYIVENGALYLTKFYNNLKVLENINVDLCNPLCSCDYHFANICRGEERYTININHKCEKTYSKVVNRSVAIKNSILKFAINSNVSKKAIKSVIDQNTRIVTMGECDAEISPNMFIPMDDVEAKHGSVIGSFNEEEVFYLMSKGINYNDTLKLLIKGYLLGNLKVDFEIRKQIIDIIDTYWR